MPHTRFSQHGASSKSAKSSFPIQSECSNIIVSASFALIMSTLGPLFTNRESSVEPAPPVSEPATLKPTAK